MYAHTVWSQAQHLFILVTELANNNTIVVVEQKALSSHISVGCCGTVVATEASCWEIIHNK